MKKHTKRENTSPVFSTTGPRGHRQRMRQKVLENGTASLADYEILEMLLFSGVPRRDTKPLAKAAINHFGSFPKVLEATPDQLRQVGFPNSSARLLGTIATIAQSIRIEVQSQKLALKDWDSVVHYAFSRRDSVENRHMCVLFLDSQNCLLADELIHTSENKDSAQDTIAYVMRRALMQHASAMVTIRFTHNADSQELMKSDKIFAMEIAEAAHVLAMQAYGHLVIGSAGEWYRFVHDNNEIT